MAPRTQAKGNYAEPGAVLKMIRAKRKMTLADVADKAGMTVSTLWKIENDRMGVNLEKLHRLSSALDIDVAQLIGSTGTEAKKAPGASRRSVTRAGEGRRIEVSQGNYVYTATDLLSKSMLPIVGEVFAKSVDECGEFNHHPGEECVFVLEGTLELHTDTYTPVTLEVGDSVYFDAEMGHAYVAVGDRPCRILSICCHERAASNEGQIQLTKASRKVPDVDEDAVASTTAHAAGKPVQRRQRAAANK